MRGGVGRTVLDNVPTLDGPDILSVGGVKNRMPPDTRHIVDCQHANGFLVETELRILSAGHLSFLAA